MTRSTVYARHPAAKLDEQELTLLGLIDAEYTRHPFYGSRKIRQYLLGVGHQMINRKRVQRLRGILDLAGMAPGPNTSRLHPQHSVYPSLLRGVVVTRPNQVWSTDIPYLHLARGFVYLVAVIDWSSRKVLSWRLSHTLASGFCVEGLEQALQIYGTPEIFNTDCARHRPQHGRARAGLGQHLCGAALAERQVRRRLSERVHYAV